MHTIKTVEFKIPNMGRVACSDGLEAGLRQQKKGRKA